MAIQDTAKEFFLDELGRTNGHLSELAAAWLATQGHTTGSIDERWQSYLAATGGALPSESLSRYLIGPLRAGASGITLAAAVSSLFQSSEPGVFYDPSDLSSLYQTSTGTTPVTSHNDPVGLMLDKRLMQGKTAAAFIASQPELWDHDSVIADGESQILGVQSYRVYSSAGAYTDVGISGIVDTTQFYQVSFNIDSIASVGGGLCVGNLGPTLTTTGPKTVVVKWNSTRAFFKRISGTTDFTISNVSIKAIPGNHAIQATSSARPVYKTEPHPNTDYSGQPELVTNGTFDTDTSGWTSYNSATLSVVSGKLRTTNSTTSSGGAYQTLTTVIGQRYKIVGDLTGTNGFLHVGTSAGSTANIGRTLVTNEAIEVFFIATATTTYITVSNNNATNGVYKEWDDISIKEVPANAQYLHWIEGDGVDDFLRATFTIAQPWDRISAIRQVSWTNGDSIYGGVTANAGTLYQTGTGPRLDIYAGTTAAANTGAAIGANAVITERYAGASSRLSVDNNAYTVGDAGTGVPGGITMLANHVPAAASNARLYPVVMREGTLTDAQIARLRTLIGAKAGLTL